MYTYLYEDIHKEKVNPKVEISICDRWLNWDIHDMDMPKVN